AHVAPRAEQPTGEWNRRRGVAHSMRLGASRGGVKRQSSHRRSPPIAGRSLCRHEQCLRRPRWERSRSELVGEGAGWHDALRALELVRDELRRRVTGPWPGATPGRRRRDVLLRHLHADLLRAELHAAAELVRETTDAGDQIRRVSGLWPRVLGLVAEVVVV